MPVLDNPRAEQFAQHLANGESQRSAYRAAYERSKSWTDKTVDSRASELAGTAEVAARVQEIQAAAAEDVILSVRDRVVILSGIAQDEANIPKSRMQAIDLLNKMDGVYTSKIEVSASDVGKTAASVAAILAEGASAPGGGAG